MAGRDSRRSSVVDMPFRILVLLGAAIAAAIATVIYPFFGVLALTFLTYGRPQDDRPNVVGLHIPLMMCIAITVGMLLRAGTTIPRTVAALKRIWVMLVLYFMMLVS